MTINLGDEKMENKCSSDNCCRESRESHASEWSSKKEDCCPVQTASDMWICAFHRAIKEAHVEVLKAKIHKAWGSKMDKTADAVLEAMEAQWTAMLTQGKAKMDLKEKIAKAMMEGKK